MKKEDLKKEKKNNNVIPMVGKKPTLKEASLARRRTVRDAIFGTINETAKKLQEEGHGVTSVNEVISILAELTFSYNDRNLSPELEIENVNEKPKE